MDMMTQMMDKMQSAATQAANRKPVAQKKDDEKGFDQMVRQKQQEVRKDQPQDKKTDARDPNAQEKPQAEGKQLKADEIPAEQYALAAAMLYQMQPNVDNVQIQSDAETLTEAPVELAAAASVTAEAAPVAELETEAPVVQEVAQRAAAVSETVRDDMPEISFETVAETVERGPRETVSAAQDVDKENPVVVLQEQADAPVFADVTAVPVKVAEPSAPIPLESEDGMAELSARIVNLMTGDNGESTVELTLTPASLGTIRVEITHGADGALEVRLSAGTEKAFHLLERGSGTLQNLLTSETRPAVTVVVRGNEQTQQQYLNPNSDGQQQSRHGQQQHQQRQEQERSSDDFMQQLRLGLVDADGER